MPKSAPVYGSMITLKMRCGFDIPTLQKAYGDE